MNAHRHAAEGDESAPRLLGPAEIRDLAELLDVTPTKKLGQNFVHDGNTVRRIVQTAGVQRGETVLEIGPGLGSLTLGLLEAGASVIAVEIDRRLAEQLPHTVRLMQPGTSLTVVTRRRAARHRAARRARAARREPAVQRVGAGAAAPARALPVAHVGHRHGAGRGRAPPRGRSRIEGLRRAEREGGLVRHAGARPGRSRAWCSGRCRTSTRCSSDSTAARSPAPRRSASRRSPSSTPRSSSDARCCGRRCRACSAARRRRRADPRAGRHRPAGARRAAARRGLPRHRPRAPSTRERPLHDPTDQYRTGIRWGLTGGAVDASRADADETQLARARLAYERRDWAAARVAYARIGDRAAIAAEDVDRESRCAWWLGDTPASIATGEELVHRLEDAGRDSRGGDGGPAARAPVGAARRRRHLRRMVREGPPTPGRAPGGPRARLPAVRHRHAGDGRHGDARRCRGGSVGAARNGTDLRFPGARRVRPRARRAGEDPARRRRCRIRPPRRGHAAGRRRRSGPVLGWRHLLHRHPPDRADRRLRRMRAWTDALDAWSAELSQTFSYAGIVRVHRLELLVAEGRWDEAAAELGPASSSIADTDTWVAGHGFAELGHVLRLRGRRDEAAEAYARALRAGVDPEPGPRAARRSRRPAVRGRRRPPRCDRVTAPRAAVGAPAACSRARARRRAARGCAWIRRRALR